MQTEQFVALIVAWVAFMVFARGRLRWRQLRQRDPHSPVGGRWLIRWIKLLVTGETEPDTDTEPEPALPRGYRLRHVDAAKTVVDWVRGDEELPLAQPTTRPQSQLHIWIRRSFEEGATYSDVVRDGKRLFGKSTATMKRAIKQVRNQ